MHLGMQPSRRFGRGFVSFDWRAELGAGGFATTLLPIIDAGLLGSTLAGADNGSRIRDARGRYSPMVGSFSAASRRHNPGGAFNIASYPRWHIAALACCTSTGVRGFLFGQDDNTGANGTAFVNVTTADAWRAGVEYSGGTITWTGATRNTAAIERVDLYCIGDNWCNFAINGVPQGWQQGSGTLATRTTFFAIGALGEYETAGVWQGLIEQLTIVLGSSLASGAPFDPYDPRPFRR